jgi:hypothetical protein
MRARWNLGTGRLPVCAAALLLLGCAAEALPTVSTAPVVEGLDKRTVVVGEPLLAYGGNFLPPDEGYTELVFEGQFIPAAGGAPINVPEYTIAPLYDGVFTEPGSVGDMAVPSGTTLLRWNRFGPFKVPFGSGDQPGTFKGTVRAVNVHRTGESEAGGTTPVSLEVGRSVIITKLSPIVGFQRDPASNAITAVETADCAAPALRGLAGLGYVLEVRAIGFQPETFRYQFTNVNGQESIPEIVHIVNGQRDTDVVGDPTRTPGDPVVVLNALAPDEGWAITTIRVTATDSRGEPVYTALPLTVTRPVAYHYDGGRELAEYYEPVNVYGPVPGSIGTNLDYQETLEESRQQGVSVGISRDWSVQTGQEKTDAWTKGVSTSQSVSTTDERGIELSESTSAEKTVGQDYATSKDTSVSIGTADGTSWTWSASKESSNETYADAMKQLSGEVSTEVSASVTGEGSIPGLAKVSGTAGTTVGASLGTTTGTSTGARQGSSESLGNSMGGSSDTSTVFGSATTDSRSQSFSGSYAIADQSSLSESTAKTTASDESASFDVSSSGSISESLSRGQSESWEQSWTSTKGQSQSLGISSKIPNGRCAVVYRQTVRWVRRAQLLSYDLCGVRTQMGEMAFNEWTWSPEIAIGSACDQVRSSLPKAQCFLSCQ